MIQLCLACSSSLPPSRSTTTVFTTRCCNKPICPACISSNPRLTRYDPCLACLGGVKAVNPTQTKNIDGAVKDSDVFAIGDDEDEEITPSPVLEHASREETETAAEPLVYYIKPGDTLQGIALRFGVQGRELCRLNKLPPSTLNTTPHLLHTRTILNLPYPVKPGALSKPEEAYGDQTQNSQHARERAEKRFQTLTKEVNWDIAKAYVALADDPEETLEYHLKSKETAVSGEASIEGRAIDRYLDDDEWERRERMEGRSVSIPRFPYTIADRTRSLKG